MAYAPTCKRGTIPATLSPLLPGWGISEPRNQKWFLRNGCHGSSIDTSPKTSPLSGCPPLTVELFAAALFIGRSPAAVKQPVVQVTLSRAPGSGQR